ncbi:MAG TPA: hypothetical protein VHB73_06275 [Alphaproteobacteria bacterium]|nr:hypothetical protein [Alphaproteobacteria bacterium]
MLDLATPPHREGFFTCLEGQINSPDSHRRAKAYGLIGWRHDKAANPQRLAGHIYRKLGTVEDLGAEKGLLNCGRKLFRHAALPLKKEFLAHPDDTLRHMAYGAAVEARKALPGDEIKEIVDVVYAPFGKKKLPDDMEWRNGVTAFFPDASFRQKLSLLSCTDRGLRHMAYKELCDGYENLLPGQQAQVHAAVFSALEKYPAAIFAYAEKLWPYATPDQKVLLFKASGERMKAGSMPVWVSEAVERVHTRVLEMLQKPSGSDFSPR